MDSKQFDDLTRALGDPPSRRALMGVIGGGLAAIVARGAPDDVDAKRKKKKKKKKKKGSQPPQCGSVTCAEGQVCCPDSKCGARCCANGYACDQPCSGPNGNDYCCPPDRPVAICNLCFRVGSTPCSTPGHCCGPNQVCCGDDHCCDIETQECRTNCAGVQGSNSCCIKGAGPTCCPQVPG